MERLLRCKSPDYCSPKLGQWPFGQQGRLSVMMQSQTVKLRSVTKGRLCENRLGVENLQLASLPAWMRAGFS